jgi:hypothetical protein
MSRLAKNESRVKANVKKHTGPWWRAYASDLDDHRIQTLPVQLFKVYVNLCHLGSLTGGELPSTSQIAFRLRLSEHDAVAAVSALIEAGLLHQSVTGDAKLSLIGWGRRQYVGDTSAGRMRLLRRRRKKEGCDVTRDAGVTSHVTGCASSTSSSSLHLTSLNPNSPGAGAGEKGPSQREVGLTRGQYWTPVSGSSRGRRTDGGDR